MIQTDSNTPVLGNQPGRRTGHKRAPIGNAALNAGTRHRAAFLILACLIPAAAAHAQLIPAGSPIPRTAKPPVVFVNGYQTTCGSNQFADNFGKFDQFLEATGRTTILFDNCLFPGKPPIEELGNNLRTFLAGLKYTDGSAATPVDIVAHSMGGLVVRSYLAGKQTTEGVFQPPLDPGIRKAVFLATPNFGSPFGNLFGVDVEAQELGSGSRFVFDLGTWNQGTDDLRGISALALIGNGGTGLAVAPGLDDGVVSLTSASIGFAEPGRTRIIPYCHTGSSLVSLGGLCPSNVPVISHAVNATDTNVTATLSFLNDTPDWQTIGQDPAQNQFLSTGGGLEARAKSSTDQFLAIQKATAGKTLNLNGNEVAWTDLLPAEATDLAITTASGTIDTKFTLPAGFTTAIIAKTGPFIARVFPSAAAINPLAVAPGSIVSVYGSNLEDAMLRVNGTPVNPLSASANQINAILPDSLQGLVSVEATGSTGLHSVNLLIEPAVPAIFTQNQAGTGPAAALNGVTNMLVTAAVPLHPGDYVSLYLTGLGSVHNQGVLQVADTIPTVLVGGQVCRVTFAGRAPGYTGLDQINCQISPSADSNTAASVSVQSSGFTSNSPTLAVQ